MILYLGDKVTKKKSFVTQTNKTRALLRMTVFNVTNTTHN